MNISRTNIILIVAGLIILAAAGYLIFGRTTPGAALTNSGQPASEDELTFISLTAQIDTGTLDASILEDPRFGGLRDIRTAVIPEETGRFDPFAPLSSGSGR